MYKRKTFLIVVLLLLVCFGCEKQLSTQNSSRDFSNTSLAAYTPGKIHNMLLEHCYNEILILEQQGIVLNSENELVEFMQKTTDIFIEKSNLIKDYSEFEKVFKPITITIDENTKDMSYDNLTKFINSLEIKESEIIYINNLIQILYGDDEVVIGEKLTQLRKNALANKFDESNPVYYMGLDIAYYSHLYWSENQDKWLKSMINIYPEYETRMLPGVGFVVWDTISALVSYGVSEYVSDNTEVNIGGAIIIGVGASFGQWIWVAAGVSAIRTFFNF